MKRSLSLLAALALFLCPIWSASAATIRMGGTGTALGSLRLLADAYEASHPGVSITILPSLGSSGGIKAVIEGAIGLAASSRPLRAEERARGAAELEYARTPFVFAIAAESASSEISTEKLADIYSGKYAVWPDGKRIRVILRPVSDVDTAMVMDMSPALRQGLLAAQARPGVRYSINDQDAANDLERIPGAIGPTTLALIRSENRKLRALILDGKEPTVANAASGAYPLFKRLFLVTGPTRDPGIQSFIDFIRSTKGRQILNSSGCWVP